MRPKLLVCSCWLAASWLASADVLDDTAALQSSLDDLAIQAVSEQWQPSGSNALAPFASVLQSEEAGILWKSRVSDFDAATDSASASRTLGALKGSLQQVLALEMLAAYQRGDLESSRQWRAAIKLPKHASALEGLLALQRIGGAADQRAEVARALARETLVWQGSRARERADDLLRLSKAGRATPELVNLRSAEIDALVRFPQPLLDVAKVPAPSVIPTARGIRDHALCAEPDS